MTYFPDLSHYIYGQECGYYPALITPLNVGWLGRGESFPTDTTGWPDQNFLDNLALFEQRAYLVNLTRGWHLCELCEGAAKEYQEDWETCLVAGKLCHDEIRVLGGDGVVYAAPAMLRHYVTTHQYKPPDSFIQAILHGSRPDSPAATEARVQSSWDATGCPEFH